MSYLHRTASGLLLASALLAYPASAAHRQALTAPPAAP